MAYLYTWIPAYQQIVTTLRRYKNNQGYLIQVLRDIGINVPDDLDSPTNNIPLSEIDPFSFLFYIGVQKNNWNKIKTIRALCDLWSIDVKVYDVAGIPTANAQRLRMFGWQFNRNNEIDRLWNIFEKLLQNSVTNADFQEITSFPGVGKIKLTDAFFIVKPNEYLGINGKVKPYLEEKGFNTEFTTFSEYQALLTLIKNNIPDPFYTVSYQAYLRAEYGNREPSYYRIGTTAGENGVSVLQEMLDNEIVSIGWGEIGNLYEIEPFNKKHVGEALQQKGYYSNDNRTASRKAGEIHQFKDDIKPGDYVLAAEGESIKALGKVISDTYIFNEELEFPHGRCVEWLYTNISGLQISEGVRTSVWKLSKTESTDAILKYTGGSRIFINDNNTNDQPNQKSNMELNRILFGPPGTGKTYRSIDLALAILGEDTNATREKRKNIFAEYQKRGKIFFCSFHQNFAYEDFIEGIKPIEPEEEDEFLKYEIRDGLFMEACIEATYSLLSQRLNTKNDEIQNYLDYNILFNELYDEVLYEGTIELTTKSGLKVQVSTTSQGNFSVLHIGKEKNFTVSRERLAVLFEKFPEISKINNITNEFRSAIGGCNSTAYWSVLNKIKELEAAHKKSNPKYRESSSIDLRYEDKKAIVKRYWKQRDSEFIELENIEPFVFIIDEINRGNVSQIFGELITLIEEDKRIGKSEVIYLDLPYSKHSFGVPPNLYIIGTMNTADRSVEALDTALRRRFSFIPMMPEASRLGVTIDGINLSAMLTTLNTRLRVLKDNDHTIGHAWFWNVKDIEGLKRVFASKILPLLQEYFYNDYEKLGLLLGNAFFKKQEQISSDIFAPFKGGNHLAGQYEQSWQYELKPVSDLTIKDFNTLEILTNKPYSDETA